MKCEIAEALIPAYLDKSCSEEVCRMLEEHIQDCPNCASLLKEFELAEQTQIEKKVPSQISVFKKVKRKHGRDIGVAVIISILVFLLFGTRVNSEIMKLRFQLYLKSHYPNSELIMSGFEYQDPQSNGFGMNNGYYIAEVASLNESEVDVNFSVMTEGFFFHIKDSYDYRVEGKIETADRLMRNYAEDLDGVLSKKMMGQYIESHIEWGCSEQYFDENAAKHLTINMDYHRFVDEVLPMSINIHLACDSNKIESLMNEVLDLLEQESFHPATIQFSFLTEQGKIEKSHSFV